MKVFIRGHAEPVEADQPVPPASPFSLVVTTTPIPRAGATADTPGTSDHSIARADSTGTPATLPALDATPSVPSTVPFAPVQLLAVASVVTDVQLSPMTRGDLGGLSDTGGGEIARGAETLASLGLDGPSYADHGWFIVPSASNEYGSAYAAADDFAFDLAAGEFSADWFWV